MTPRDAPGASGDADGASADGPDGVPPADGLGVAVLNVDGRGTVTTANARARSVLGGGEELAGTKATRLFPRGLPDPAEDPERERLHPTRGAPLDGGGVDLLVHVEADGDGRVVTALSADRVPENEDAEQSGGAPEGAAGDAELRRFIHGVSHDLRQPLNIVTGSLDLLSTEVRDDLGDRHRAVLDRALEGAEKTEDLLDQLLTYSRVALGDAEEPSDSAVDLNDVLAEARSNVGTWTDQEDAAVEVEDLPSVRGDRTQLVQLFQNLVANGLSYHDEEPRRVRVHASTGDGECRVTVEDNGVGVDPDEREAIFSAFERGSAASGTEGSGLGLALCQRVVDDLGGRIELDSTPGEGSAFHVYLPLADAADDATGVETGTEADAGGDDADGATAGQTSVVLVDDVEGLRALVESALERTGRYEVVGQAGTGQGGIDVSREMDPDLVLLDLSMPEMDGLEALPRIREGTTDATVVIFSGFEEDRMAEEALEAGAAAYLEKGLDPDELVAELDRVLDETDASGDAMASAGTD